MGSRACELIFTNATTVILYRHLLTLDHGTWVALPPEYLRPGKRFIAASETTRLIGSFAGKVEYSVVLADVSYIIRIIFQLPWLSTPKASATFGLSERPRRTDLPELPNIFALSTNTYQVNSSIIRVVIELTETKDGAFFLDRVRKKISEGSKRYIEAFFTFNVRNVDWLLRLRKSLKSVRIRIVNLTRRPFVLSSSLPPVSLSEGIWVEYPSTRIIPLGFTEFGCHSKNMLSGVAGVAKYSVSGEQGVLVFVWNHPSMGNNYVDYRDTGNRFTITSHAEWMNEATIVFHVYDFHYLPPTKVLTAKCIPPSFVSHVLQKTSSVSSSALLSAVDVTKCATTICELLKNMNIEAQGFDVTSAFIDYACVTDLSTGIGELIDTEYYGNIRSVSLVSPRAFFCNISSNPNVPGNKSIQSNSFLLLKWRIACEQFVFLWPPDSEVSLSPGVVGGLDLKEVIINSVATRNNAECLSDLLATTTAFTSPKETEPTQDSFLSTLVESECIALSVVLNPETLYELTFNTLRCLASGLHPVVVNAMAKRFGNDWLRHADIPAWHMWKAKDTFLDIQALLTVVVSYWNEEFHTVIGSSRVLLDLQNDTIFWANQELSKFEAPYVQKLVFNAAGLLMHIQKIDLCEEVLKNYHTVFTAEKGFKSISSNCMKEKFKKILEAEIFIESQQHHGSKSKHSPKGKSISVKRNCDFRGD